VSIASDSASRDSASDAVLGDWDAFAAALRVRYGRADAFLRDGDGEARTRRGQTRGGVARANGRRRSTVVGIARFVGTRHVGRDGCAEANAPEMRAYLPETTALPLSDERVATEAACTFVESIVGAIAGSNAEWRCRRRARATGLIDQRKSHLAFDQTSDNARTR
jgi:hypothetical protein